MSNLTVYFIIDLNANFQHEPTQLSVNIANFLTFFHSMLRLSQIRAQNLVSVPLTFLTLVNCPFPGYDGAGSGSSLQTFRDNLSVPT
jgi:hypothetical protein